MEVYRWAGKNPSESFIALAAGYGKMSASMYRLVFQPHTTARQPVAGDAAHLLIGRAANCGLCLTDAGVRDQHAAIERHDTGYIINDLTNSNSVRVNGIAITSQRLTTGDEIELGTVRLKFEVVHEPPPGRRAFDSWQFFGIGLVAVLVVGQLALFVWIFSQPHPRNAHIDIVTPKTPESTTAPVPAAAPALVPLAASVPAVTGAPEVLSRMLKIVRVERTDPTTLRVIIKAQVGDRQLDPKAVAVSVQCFPAPPGGIQWLTIPVTWENFKTKELSARLPGLCPNYIVRTFYKNQPQDVVTVTPAKTQ